MDEKRQAQWSVHRFGQCFFISTIRSQKKMEIESSQDDFTDLNTTMPFSLETDRIVSNQSKNLGEN